MPEFRDLLDAEISDRLLLESLPGALDYLAADLAELPPAHLVRRSADSILIDWHGPLRALARIRYYSGCAVWLGEDSPSQTASRATGVLSLMPNPTFRVAPDLGVDRWPLRDELEAMGWRNEPSDWQLNLKRVDGGLVAEVGALFQTARFGKLERIPASTTPVISAVLIRLLKAEAGQLVLDPFCGAATNLVSAAAMVPGVRLLGSDVHPRALVAAAANLPIGAGLIRADAARLPVPEGSVDRVVANLPFGKRVGSHGINQALYPAFLRQLTRILTSKGRAVLLTDDKRLLTESIQRTANLRVIKEVQFASGGLHPSAYVLTRGRGRQRRG